MRAKIGAGLSLHGGLLRVFLRKYFFNGFQPNKICLPTKEKSQESVCMQRNSHFSPERFFLLYFGSERPFSSIRTTIRIQNGLSFLSMDANGSMDTMIGYREMHAGKKKETFVENETCLSEHVCAPLFVVALFFFYSVFRVQWPQTNVNEKRSLIVLSGQSHSRIKKGPKLISPKNKRTVKNSLLSSLP